MKSNASFAYPTMWDDGDLSLPLNQRHQFVVFDRDTGRWMIMGCMGFRPKVQQAALKAAACCP
ncbi:hypothetical protein BV98_000188 [Sphingobium herbicidovorans NBRC 16415]|uniref:Uncharacterized protein n=1 Tax=Sphingobium herbicidovorans (strain ATCC 700291 / DSM 11019 / CCUG 56400 / KCTC 2939 / LMG 18315 / NBRC 16415 / MH) TaxID=1219045 RepID=A0A086PEW9_SPHHM|nr:hypothetical protein [Sphingobium herbicidovorans]KFG91937.1 hypothetical protein BV98_000188 [Sphingobium herbicidovorans NBRC 16415]